MVKAYYKVTESALKDWEIKFLDDFGSVVSGGTPSTHIGKYWGGSIAWCTPSDVTATQGKYISKTERYITTDGLKNSSAYLVPENSLLICTRATIGELKINKVSMATNQGFKNLILNEDTCVDYLYYLLKTKKQNMIELAIGSTFLEISKKAICQIPLQTPPLLEQQKIAGALSDIDKLIDSLEKLIEKKKTIKNGAMQELLTGKKRLSSFSGEWKKINLAKESKIKARIGWQGLTTAEYLDSGYAYLVTGTDFSNGFVDWDGCHYVEKNRFDQDKNIKLQNGDILITKDGSLGKVAYVSGLSKPATLNSGVFVIRPTQNAYDTRFVYYVLSSFVFKNFLEQLSAGSTITHLYQKDMNKFEFYIPNDIDEQKAIADILFDMDTEISALEQKLVKYHKIKQGMMQQLLTGKIRLISSDDNSNTDDTATYVSKEPAKRHNHQFDDAVVIAAIVGKFYSDRFPLGRKKVRKLLYLFRRHQEADTSIFKKKAAGPYADEVRYKGGEPIAKEKQYIALQTSNKGTLFSKGKSINDALVYINKWDFQKDIDWLVSKFKYTKTNDLELLSTVDMAMCDLRGESKNITLNNIKALINSSEEWKTKLLKPYFTDRKIEWAIQECRGLFD